MSSAEIQELAAVDNDILIKISCYGLHNRLLGETFAVLGAARFVVRGRLARMPLNGDRQAAQDAGAQLISRALAIEPTDEELVLAAELERVAQRRSRELDAGESQLAAVVVVRVFRELITGDKRAVCALDQLLDEVPALTLLTERVRCLEQLVADVVDPNDGHEEVARAICSEPNVDKTLTICARCHSPAPHGPAIDRDGLRSYIEQLRTQAPRVLRK